MTTTTADITAASIRETSSNPLRNYLVADLFCGAGGSSTGAQKAIESIGGTMNLVAINHWPVAVETHSRNHPQARHYVQNLETADPETIVPEGYLDLLMASPECRFFSRARGGKPTHEQGRMSPWIVQRWLTSINVRCLLWRMSRSSPSGDRYCQTSSPTQSAEESTSKSGFAPCGAWATKPSGAC